MASRSTSSPPRGRLPVGGTRSPDPRHLAALARPGFVRAAPTLPGTSRSRLPSAPAEPLRRPNGEGLPPPLKPQRLTAHEAGPQRIRHHLRRPHQPECGLTMPRPDPPFIPVCRLTGSGGLAPPVVCRPWLLSVVRPVGRERDRPAWLERSVASLPDWDMPTDRSRAPLTDEGERAHGGLGYRCAQAHPHRRRRRLKRPSACGAHAFGTATADHLALLRWADQFEPARRSGGGRSRTAGTCRAGSNVTCS